MPRALLLCLALQLSGCGPLAPYRIDITDERLHCGIDVFNLSRENGKWLVDSVSFTMEPDACPELEPEGVAARPVFAD